MEIEIGYNLSIKTTSLFLYFLRSDKVEVVREIIYLIFNQGGWNMFYNARNCNIKIDDTDMDYISFGNGNKSLVIIPGLGEH